MHCHSTPAANAVFVSTARKAMIPQSFSLHPLNLSPGHNMADVPMEYENPSGWYPEPSLAGPSPQMFHGATRFGIYGSQQFTHVQGGMHIHPTTTIPVVGAQQPYGGIVGQQSAGISDMGIQNSPSFSQDAVVSFYSESGSYCSHLLRQGRGFPLYVPRPQRSLPEEYQRNGVAIGDVGRVTTEGVFDFFFNIYLPADHPINANFVPEDFYPLTPYVSRDILQVEFDPGNYVSSAFIQAWDPNAVMDEFPGSEFLFSCMGPSGAVLALPHGAYLEKLEYVEHARRYAARNAESWYKYINETRGGGLTNGSLYLITGCEKSRSGGMASFQNVLPGAEFQLSFRPTTNADAGYKYRFNRGTPVKTKNFDEAEQHDEGPLNHTTFLHGFSISLGEGIWGRLFGKVTVSEIGESDMRSSPSGFVPFGQQGSLFSWPLNIFGGGEPTGGRKYTDQNEQEIMVSEFSPMSETVHPGRTINNFLLRQYPEAAVVMTHDDDWRDILRDDGTEAAIKDTSELLECVSEQFMMQEEEGAIFLVSKSESSWIPPLFPFYHIPTSSGRLSPRVSESSSSHGFHPRRPMEESRLRHHFDTSSVPSVKDCPELDTVSVTDGSSSTAPSYGDDGYMPSPPPAVLDKSFLISHGLENPFTQSSSPQPATFSNSVTPQSPSGIALFDGGLPLRGNVHSFEPVGPNQEEPAQLVRLTPAVRLATAGRRKQTAKYKCELCGADFTAKHNLQNHLNSHNTTKSFNCQYCGQWFGTKAVLQRHQKRCTATNNLSSDAPNVHILPA